MVHLQSLIKLGVHFLHMLRDWLLLLFQSSHPDCVLIVSFSCICSMLGSMLGMFFIYVLVNILEFYLAVGDQFVFWFCSIYLLFFCLFFVIFYY